MTDIDNKLYVVLIQLAADWWSYVFRFKYKIISKMNLVVQKIK